MIADLILGIAAKLRTVYPEEQYKIYTEPVSQDLIVPCFLLLPISVSQKQVLGNRYRLSQMVDVQYFPTDSLGKEAEIEEVAAELFDLLEVVAVDKDLVRGSALNYEKQEGVLHFFASYDLFVQKLRPVADDMADLAINNNLKE